MLRALKDVYVGNKRGHADTTVATPEVPVDVLVQASKRRTLDSRGSAASAYTAASGDITAEFVIRPWLTPSGQPNLSFLRAVFLRILDTVLGRPHVTERFLFTELSALAACDVYDLLSALVQAGFLIRERFTESHFRGLGEPEIETEDWSYVARTERMPVWSQELDKLLASL